MAGAADERPSRTYRRSKRFRVEVAALGKRVRALRKTRGWTLEEASERMHLDLKHFQKVEAGPRAKLNITMVTLVRIAEGFGVPMARLFGGRGR
jgi:transcriptional regulator with XRE-family HTH domain